MIRALRRLSGRNLVPTKMFRESLQGKNSFFPRRQSTYIITLISPFLIVNHDYRIDRDRKQIDSLYKSVPQSFQREDRQLSNRR